MQKFKSIAFLLAITFLYTHDLVAQVTIGPQLGISRSSIISTDGVNNKSPEYGFTAGIFANVEAGDWFSLQPEVSYVRVGGSYTTDIATRSFKINYITVPVLAKLHLPISDHFFPTLGVGPYFAAKLDGTYMFTPILAAAEVDLSNEIRNWDYGVVISPGLVFRTNDVTLGLDIRYSVGMSDINREGSPSSYYRKAKSGVIFGLVRLGYRLGGEG